MNCKREGCGNLLSEKRLRHHSKYCSDECKQMDYKSTYHKLNPNAEVRSRKLASITGVTSELKVVIDLLGKGYEVFRAVNSLASCDLAILFKDKLSRIEVTTGHYSSKDGKIFYPEHKKNNFDILAVVLHDRIYYFPELPT